MSKIAIIASLCLLLTGLAAAQIPTSGNIFVGYSLENASSSALNLNLSRPNLQGWEASLEGKVAPWFGIVADFSGHYGSESFTQVTPGGPLTVNVTGHQQEVLFGPRVSVPVSRLSPFGEFVVGVSHLGTGGTFPGSTNTSFATALGGGLDYRLIRPIALRLEGDYLTTRFFSTRQNNLRLSTGIVFRF